MKSEKKLNRPCKHYNCIHYLDAFPWCEIYAKLYHQLKANATTVKTEPSERSFTDASICGFYEYKKGVEE